MRRLLLVMASMLIRLDKTHKLADQARMTDQTRLLPAALWMSGSIVAFTAMAVAVRQLKGIHDTFEILAWRSLIGFALILAVAVATGHLRHVRANRLGSHLVRNIVHFSGQSLWLWALTVIPLAQVFALEFTAPIWVNLLGPLVLGERLTGARLIAAGLGFVGILIVARPDFGNIDPGVLAAAGAAIFFAVTSLLTKRLTSGEAIVSILFWLTLMQFCFGTVVALADGHTTWPTRDTIPWLGLIAVAGVTAHLCLTTALSLAPAAFVAPLDFIRLPVIALIGATYYAEPLQPALLFGASLIVLGNLINIRSEARSYRQQ